MEKKVKLFKTITIILFIVAISLISFIGVFKSKLNFKQTLIPEFKYGMEIDGNREFKFVLDTSSEEKNIYLDEKGNYKGIVVEQNQNDETSISLDATVEESNNNIASEEVNKLPYTQETRTLKANEDNVLNKDSYEKTKAIIQKRLENAQIPEYNIRLNTITGELILEVPADDYTEKAFNLANQQGNFEIVDSETGVILLDNSHLKNVKALYTANDNYQAYLQIEFNNEGAEILKKISKEYVQTTDEAGETKTRNVELKLDNSTLLSTYFGEELDQGILQFTMGNATSDYNTFTESYNTAQEFANIVNFGKTPNKLSLASDNFVQSQITKQMIMYSKIGFVVMILILSIIFIVKYKLDGMVSAICSIGYIAITMLVIKYTNVIITLNGVLAILGITIINYVFMFIFLNRKKSDSAKHAFLETLKELNLAIVPLWIVAIIFTFMTQVTINSFGMILFWGLFLHCIYSFIITRTLYI